jgi:putative transposase
MTDKSALLDELLKDCKNLGDVSALHGQLLQRMLNRSLEAEMEAHLGYGTHEKPLSGELRGNKRNGKIEKTLQSTHGEIVIETPRDGDGSNLCHS